MQKGIAETTFMATGSKVISETNVDFRDLTDTVDVKEIVRIAKARKKDVDHTFQ